MSAQSLLDHALNYASLGWRVFPVARDKSPLTTNGFKDATVDERQIRSWWTRFPDAGIGVATGKVSGIVVLDVDLEKEGTSSSLQTLLDQRGSIPEEVVSRTGGGGYHFFFRHPGPDVTVSNAQRLFGLTGIDVRGDGGYVVVPPSPHLSGNFYEWGDGQSPFIASPSECPEYIYNHSTTRRSLSFSNQIVEGERNATLASLAGLLRSMGCEERDILLVLRSQNDARCNPPLPDAEVESIAFHMAQLPPYPNRGDGSDVPNVGLNNLLLYEHTDKGFGEMLALVLTGQIKFDHTSGRWLLWRRHWWETDTREEILQKVYTVTDLYRQAVDLITDAERKDVCAKYGRRIQNLSAITPALTTARSLPQVSTSREDWDRNPDVFAVQNGVIDLKVGRLRDGFPQDYILSHSPVVYDPAAEAPRWMQFLNEVFLEKKEVIDFVQTAVGYSLTGQTVEQCLFLGIGDGSNGKSKFLEALHKLMGNYAYAAPFSTFVRGFGPQSNTNDIAALNGRRLVTASETNEGTSLDESRIKSLTGGEPISARFLHKEFFEFYPICKIWLGVNHAPRVHDDSDGFWRRMRRIDFPAKFDGNNRDPNLSEKLQAELPGILRWAVEGSVRWYQHGLLIPKSVVASTSSYREDSDPLHQFLDAHCIVDADEIVALDDLYKAYVADGKSRMQKSYELKSSSWFHTRLGRDFEKLILNGRRYYKGIGLRPESANTLLSTVGLTTIRPVTRGN